MHEYETEQFSRNHAKYNSYEQRFLETMPNTILMNKVRNKETNEEKHGRNAMSRQDMNLGLQAAKPIP